MSHDHTYGHTDAGRPIQDEDIERLAEEAERGYDVETLLKRRGKRGRPALGSAPAGVESVRLDPELREELAAARSVPEAAALGGFCFCRRG